MVKSSGLRLRDVASLVPLTFIASTVGTCDLKTQILQYFAQMSVEVIESCQQAWCDINVKPIPDGPSATKQCSRDNRLVEREFSILL